ncbi:MAG TPA: protein jag [Clostridia bacterium]|nr:protein jag [Clostridia bacterium]
MRSVEAKGRTIDEAISNALTLLGVPRERVAIEILEEPSRGIFGMLGAREGRIRATVKENKEEFVHDFLGRVFKAMDLEVKMHSRTENGCICFDIEGPNLGVLIGRRGQTLDALQYIVNLAAGKATGEGGRITLDVEGYRKRRNEALVRLAKRMAEKAKRTGQRVVMEPMGAGERRVIHLALQNDPDVSTRSEGNEPYRRVIISAVRR